MLNAVLVIVLMVMVGAAVTGNLVTAVLAFFVSIPLTSILRRRAQSEEVKRYGRPYLRGANPRRWRNFHKD